MSLAACSFAPFCIATKNGFVESLVISETATFFVDPPLLPPLVDLLLLHALRPREPATTQAATAANVRRDRIELSGMDMS